jgi:hypothetical protein
MALVKLKLDKLNRSWWEYRNEYGTASGQDGIVWSGLKLVFGYKMEQDGVDKCG